MGQVARESVFNNLFTQVEKGYDAVLIDVAPSINLLQTCAMVYGKSLLIPVSMDPLSLQGAAASIDTDRDSTRGPASRNGRPPAANHRGRHGIVEGLVGADQDSHAARDPHRYDGHKRQQGKEISNRLRTPFQGP